MQGHFCFIKCFIFEWLQEVDVKPSVGFLTKLARVGPLYFVLKNRRLTTVRVGNILAKRAGAPSALHTAAGSELFSFLLFKCYMRNPSFPSVFPNLVKV